MFIGPIFHFEGRVLYLREESSMTYQPYNRVHIGLFPLGGPYDYRAPIPLRTHHKPACNGFSSKVVLRILEFLVASYVLFSRNKMAVANSTFVVSILIGLLLN